MSVTPSDVLPSCFSIWRAHTFGENPQIWRGCKCGLSPEPWIVSSGPAGLLPPDPKSGRDKEKGQNAIVLALLD